MQKIPNGFISPQMSNFHRVKQIGKNERQKEFKAKQNSRGGEN
jgi:hypothetical protein